MPADPARHDAAEVLEVGLDVEADAVEAHPVAQPEADRGDLVLDIGATLRPAHPDADAIGPDLAGNVEPRQRGDQPRLQQRHEAADIATATAQVEHHVGDALTRPVIGELPAAARLMHREPVRLQQILRPGAGAGRVERRMLQQPYQLAGATLGDGGDAVLHHRHRRLVGHLAVADRPVDNARRHGAGINSTGRCGHLACGLSTGASIRHCASVLRS